MPHSGRFRVLIVDDDPNVRSGLALALADDSYAIETAGDVEEARAALRQGRHDLIITDLKMPGSAGGLDLVRSVQNERPETRMIVITAFGSVRTAVEAMRLGAQDVLTKPLDMDVLRAHVRDAFEHHRLREENRTLRARLALAGELPEMVGQSAAFRDLTAMVRQVADADVAILIIGESGSGKELVARAIHELSPRRAGPFIIGDLGAIPEALVPRELFGHEPGEFPGALRRKPGWFEMARGGTLLLDALDEAPHQVQADLFRVIERRAVRRLGGDEAIPVDARLIVTVQEDIEDLINAGKLPEDINTQLNAVPLRVPPLRERRDDIPILARHFLRQAEQRLHREPKQIAGASMKVLCDFDWPGNVRQLRNVIDRLAVTIEGPAIHADDLPPEMRAGPAASDATSLDAAVEEAEKAAIRAALVRCNYHRERTAKLLGVSVRTLHYKLNRYDLQ